MNNKTIFDRALQRLRWLRALFRMATAAGRGRAADKLLAAHELVRLDPDDVDALDFLAEVQAEVEDWHNAASTSHAILRIEPHHVETLRRLAFCEFREGRPENALKHLKLAVSITESKGQEPSWLHSAREFIEAAEKTPE